MYGVVVVYRLPLLLPLLLQLRQRRLLHHLGANQLHLALRVEVMDPLQPQLQPRLQSNWRRNARPLLSLEELSLERLPRHLQRQHPPLGRQRLRLLLQHRHQLPHLKLTCLT